MEGKPGSSSRKERIKTMLLRREQVRLDVLHARRRARALAYVKNADVKRLAVAEAGAGTRYTLAGTFTLLNGLVRGTADGQRVGRQITIKRVYHCAAIEENAVGESGVARCILFYDKQSNGVAPTAALLLETTAVALSDFNIDNEQRFVVLADTLVSFNDNGASPGVIKFDIDDLDLKVTYNTGNAGTVADIATGALYLFRTSAFVAGFDTSSYNMDYYDM